MNKTPRRIESMRELTRLIPSMVKEINADPALALRAAANPLLAVEELGYELEPSLRVIAERRARFPEKTATQLTNLAEEVFGIAGEQFDIDSDVEVNRVLIETLKLSDPDTPARDQKSKRSRAKTRSSDRATPAAGAFADPFERWRDAHPIVEPLLKYRALSATEPRLAHPELYERVKRGDVQLPATRIQYRLKRGKTPK